LGSDVSNVVAAVDTNFSETGNIVESDVANVVELLVAIVVELLVAKVVSVDSCVEADLFAVNDEFWSDVITGVNNVVDTVDHDDSTEICNVAEVVVASVDELSVGNAVELDVANVVVSVDNGVEID
jgi:hypothetical protein